MWFLTHEMKKEKEEKPGEGMFRFHLSNYMSTIADNGIITVRPLHGMEPLFQP